MSQIGVKILHQDYTLTCPDGQESTLHAAVRLVDEQLDQMRQSVKASSRERVSVLLAVNLAYENLQLQQQIAALQAQLQTPAPATTAVMVAPASNAPAAVLPSAADMAVESERAARLLALEQQVQHDAVHMHALSARIAQVLAATQPAEGHQDIDGAQTCTPAESLALAPHEVHTHSQADSPSAEWPSAAQVDDLALDSSEDLHQEALKTG